MRLSDDDYDRIPGDVMDEYRRERARTPWAQAYAEYQDTGVWPEDWDEDEDDDEDEEGGENDADNTTGSDCPAAKTYRDNPQIGAVRHSVSFNDGMKTHKDGSPFFDLRVFKRSKDKEAFIRGLEADGYISEAKRQS